MYLKYNKMLSIDWPCYCKLLELMMKYPKLLESLFQLYFLLLKCDIRKFSRLQCQPHIYKIFSSNFSNTTSLTARRRRKERRNIPLLPSYSRKESYIAKAIPAVSGRKNLAKKSRSCFCMKIRSLGFIA